MVMPQQKVSQIPSQMQMTNTSSASLMASEQFRSDTVAWVNKHFTDCKNNRLPYDNSWKVNIAFYLGKQYVQINPYTRSAELMPMSGGKRPRLVINLVRRAIRMELANLLSQKPSVSVIPASIDNRDYFAAQAGTSIWDNFYRTNKVSAHIRDAQWWTRLTGTGYLKVYWNPNSVDKLNNMKGDIVLQVVNPFDIYVPDITILDIEDQPYVIHTQLKPLDWLYFTYPDRADEISAEISKSSNTTSTENIVNNSIFSPGANSLVGNVNKSPMDQIFVKEVWIKPNQLRRFPKGGILTIVNDQLVDYWEGWPYEHGMYPFVKFDNINSGRYYTDSIINDLLAPQKSVNAIHNSILENVRWLASPRYVFQQGSLDPTKITTDPSQHIGYIPGFDKPDQLVPAQMPGYAAQELERLAQEIAHLSGDIGSSNNAVPPGVTAATAISYLQELGNSLYSSSASSIENGIEKLARMVLSLVRQYWTVPRMIRVSGPSAEFDIRTFQGSDLSANSDIVVEAGSALPSSKAARQAFILDMMKLGFIEPKQGLAILDVGGINKITEQLEVDSAQIQRENMRMSAITEEMLMQHQQLQQQMMMVNPQAFMDANGQPLQPPPMIPVNSWDDDLAHIQGHNNWRKSADFESASPVTKQIAEEHIKMHMQALIDKTLQGQQMVPNNPSVQGGQPAPPQQGNGNNNQFPNDGMSQSSQNGQIG